MPEPGGIDGIRVIHEAVSLEQEMHLLRALVDEIPVDDFEILSNARDRRRGRIRSVRHFGYRFNYTSNSISLNEDVLEDSPLPDCLREVMKAHEALRCMNQATVSVYEPGSGIPPHVDTHSCFGDVIASLSLNDDTIFTFSQNRAEITDDDRPRDRDDVHVVLRRRSLLLMEGEARYRYEHGIKHRKTDVIDGRVRERGVRVSITFRRVIQHRCCRCEYPHLCDSDRSTVASDAHDDGIHIPELEIHHVRSIYTNAAVAQQVLATRTRVWPPLHRLLRELSSHRDGIMIDVGCGFGRYLSSVSTMHVLAIDISLPLLLHAKDRSDHALAVQADALRVPLRSQIAEFVISVGLLQHICSHSRRLSALEELCRCVRVGGNVLIVVAALENDDGDLVEQDMLQPLQVAPRFRSADEPIKSRHAVHHEYMHVFRQEELRDLMLSVDGLSILELELFETNWYLTAIRTH